MLVNRNGILELSWNQSMFRNASNYLQLLVTMVLRVDQDRDQVLLLEYQMNNYKLSIYIKRGGADRRPAPINMSKTVYIYIYIYIYIQIHPAAKRTGLSRFWKIKARASKCHKYIFVKMKYKKAYANYLLHLSFLRKLSIKMTGYGTLI